MLLRVVVFARAQFEQWLRNETARPEPLRTLLKTRGGFVPARNVFWTVLHQLSRRARPGGGRCQAAGRYAPDLTHLMSRETLASGVVANTPENLRRWVADPQTIKPGCLMPAFGFVDRERDDIVRYLQTLR